MKRKFEGGGWSSALPASGSRTQVGRRVGAPLLCVSGGVIAVGALYLHLATEAVKEIYIFASFIRWFFLVNWSFYISGHGFVFWLFKSDANIL